MVQGPVVVVLAAGRGTRFGAGGDGGHKLQQPFGDSTVLGTTLAMVQASGLPLVVVTTEALHDSVAAQVAEADIVVLPADGVDAPRQGMGWSIASGVTARPHARGWLLLPGDMPLVQPATLQALVAALPQHLVVYAQHRGRRGHPVGFGPELYSELAMLSGDEGARRLLARYPVQGVEVPDGGVLLDIDTEADLQQLRSQRVTSSDAAAA
ncbi:MAG TPA: nucleotidyltransferase family protein [Methylibium sp.]|nr:nucleotidyltransferase family protein [Methylibium sp.]